jgi:integrase
MGRASEVVALSLDDIRWRQGVLRIHQRKTSSPLDSYAFNRKQKYFNKSHTASSSWMMLLMDASAL